MLTAVRVKRLGAVGRRTEYEIVLREGRNREIRRMLEALGCRVVALVRVALGSLTLDGLRSGGWRHLTPQEVAMLQRAGRQPGGGSLSSRVHAGG